MEGELSVFWRENYSSTRRAALSESPFCLANLTRRNSQEEMIYRNENIKNLFDS